MRSAAPNASIAGSCRVTTHAAKVETGGQELALERSAALALQAQRFMGQLRGSAASPWPDPDLGAAGRQDPSGPLDPEGARLPAYRTRPRRALHHDVPRPLPDSQPE